MSILLLCNLNPFFQSAYRLEIIFISTGYDSALQRRGLVHETNCVFYNSATVCSSKNNAIEGDANIGAHAINCVCKLH